MTHWGELSVDPWAPIKFFFEPGAALIATSVFVLIGLASYWAERDRRHRPSLRAAFTFVFPPAFYLHCSSRMDFVNFVIARIFTFSLVAVVTGITIGRIQYQGLMPGSGIDPFGSHVVPLAISQTLIILFASDSGSFFSHILMHKTKLLWNFHSVHHSAEVLTPFTFDRNHPIDVLITQSVIAVFTIGGTMLAMFVGNGVLVPDIALLALIFGALTAIHAMVSHSHFWVDFGRFNAIIMSPTLHQIHHSAEERHLDVNFANWFPMWDWLFGTLYLPKTRERFDVGMNSFDIGAKNPHRTVATFYGRPITGFVRDLTDAIGGRAKTSGAAAVAARDTE